MAHQHGPRCASARVYAADSADVENPRRTDLSREVGGAFGIAILGSVLNSGYRSKISPFAGQLPHRAAGPVEGSIAAALQFAPTAGRPGAVLVDHAQHAFVSGLSNSFVMGAGALLVAAVLIALLATRRGDIEPAQIAPGSRPSRRARGNEAQAAVVRAPIRIRTQGPGR